MYAAINLKQNLRLMYCTIEANDRHEAWCGLFATAELLVVTRHRKRCGAWTGVLVAVSLFGFRYLGDGGTDRREIFG